MNGSSTEREISPVVWALAEARAREAGLGVSEMFEQMLLPTGRSAAHPHTFYDPRLPTALVGPKFSGTNIPHLFDLDTVSSNIQFAGGHQPSHFDHLRSIYHSPRSAIDTIKIFQPKISTAAILLGTAFAEARVMDFGLPARRRRMPADGHFRLWYDNLVVDAVRTSRDVRCALVHDWTPSGRAEQLWYEAFVVLCDLIPAGTELIILCNQDRASASYQLSRHLEAATTQFELAADALFRTEKVPSPAEANENRFRQLRSELLERADGGVSLTEGAKILGLTRQALHKRIRNGNSLGMIDGAEIVLPRFQWTDGSDGKIGTVDGLPAVVRLFERAGGWSALQFLLDCDPNLGRPPIEVLREGRTDDVVSAARAYLGLDEG